MASTPEQKRCLDRWQRTLDIVGLLLWSPPFLLAFPILCLMVWLKIGRPIFFRQIRPGRGGKPFAFFKFRTMTDARDLRGELLPDEERLGPFGRFLRSTSMDELPQILNVIKGDIGLVGPRPLLMEYLPLYTPEQAKRNEVRPGITGWSQINGRNAVSWEEKLAMDVWYVENRSIGLYFHILFRSVLKILKRDGVNAAESVTMPRFTGSGR